MIVFSFCRGSDSRATRPLKTIRRKLSDFRRSRQYGGTNISSNSVFQTGTAFDSYFGKDETETRGNHGEGGSMLLQ
jgi:hypothetical protein